MVRHAPPPTKFGPQGIAQAKPAAGPAARVIHVPPPSRFQQTGQVVLRAMGPVSQPPPRPARSGTIQAMIGKPAFTQAGADAWKRVSSITSESLKQDPYDGVTFYEWHSALTRIGFNKAIYDWVLDHAVRDTGRRDGWVTCPYCNYEYPDEMLNVDHITDWAAHSLAMTTATYIEDALAWHVYVGCNDPNNLRPVCKYCNSSKGKRPITQEWLDKRKKLAKERGGFGW